MNVFEYAAANEAAFEEYWSMCGHERKTTFFSDLSIAEWCGVDGIKDTYKRVIKEWMPNLVYITEFIACLGLKASQWSGRGNSAMCELYSRLYEDGQRAFYKHYANDEKAKDYFFQITD